MVIRGWWQRGGPEVVLQGPLTLRVTSPTRSVWSGEKGTTETRSKKTWILTWKGMQSTATEKECGGKWKSMTQFRWIISATRRERKPQALPLRQPGGTPMLLVKGIMQKEWGKMGRAWRTWRLKTLGKRRGATNTSHWGNKDGTSRLPMKEGVTFPLKCLLRLAITCVNALVLTSWGLDIRTLKANDDEAKIV